MRTHATLELELCCYKLVPSKRSTARRLVRAAGLKGDERTAAEDAIMEGVLYQVDWDYPALAEMLGWDGKIPKGLSQVAAAGEWLGDHIDQEFMVDEEVFNGIL